jgi:hypothetical protein
MLVTEFGIVGAFMSDWQQYKNFSPMIVTEFAITGGVWSDVQSPSSSSFSHTSTISSSLLS